MTHPPSILVCGHRSFAARGLVELLRGRGHAVTCFNRGSVGVEDGSVTGPVAAIDQNPHLAGPFDVVINYILLKDDDIQRNNDYLAALLRLCRRVKAAHLIHISSVSVYRGSLARVVEDSPIESDPNRKGSYGSLKVATDQFLLAHVPGELKLTLLRPGFILGRGVMDPIIGMGFRFGLNRVLMIGSGRNVLPVTSRDIVNEAVARVVDKPPDGPVQALLVLDNQSPTRREWLMANARLTGCGTGLLAAPVPLWLLAGLGGEVVARLAGMKLRPFKIIRNACRAQTFDASISQRRLGMDMRLDWKQALSDSLPFQQPNFALPYRRIDSAPLRAGRITFWGFGQIVKQKHLPALRRLGFNGQLSAHDLKAGVDESGVEIRPIDGPPPQPTDLMVVVSPGPVHTQAVPMLRGVEATILVEKPLCYRADELRQWEDLARTRRRPVLVCHNYRFKHNVARMMSHLDRFNPGRIIQVDVHFQSPSIGKEWRTWTKDERKARTLLMDYSVHYLDLACMFADEWSLDRASHDLDFMGYTGTIQGRLSCPQYPVNFLLRQGHMPRRARLLFTFQNYCVSLGFSPDTFVAHMADDNAAIHGAEKRASARAFRSKVLDKILGRDADRSHDAAYLAAVNSPDELGGAITVQRLAGFYRAMADLGQAVYEQEKTS
jgi:nucleoside-diphosphate-sugar epimerase